MFHPAAQRWGSSWRSFIQNVGSSLIVIKGETVELYSKPAQPGFRNDDAIKLAENQYQGSFCVLSFAQPTKTIQRKFASGSSDIKTTKANHARFDSHTIQLVINHASYLLFLLSKTFLSSPEMPFFHWNSSIRCFVKHFLLPFLHFFQRQLCKRKKNTFIWFQMMKKSLLQFFCIFIDWGPRKNFSRHKKLEYSLCEHKKASLRGFFARFCWRIMHVRMMA